MNLKLKRLFTEERIGETKDIFEGICSHLEGMYDAKVKDAFDNENYTNPSWSEYQADKLGSLRTLQELILLFKVNNDV